jgi:hypothetical protein
VDEEGAERLRERFRRAVVAFDGIRQEPVVRERVLSQGEADF